MISYTARQIQRSTMRPYFGLTIKEFIFICACWQMLLCKRDGDIPGLCLLIDRAFLKQQKINNSWLPRIKRIRSGVLNQYFIENHISSLECYLITIWSHFRAEKHNFLKQCFEAPYLLFNYARWWVLHSAVVKCDSWIIIITVTS